MRRLIALVLTAAITACSTAAVVPPAPAELCAQPGLWAVLAEPRPSGGAAPPAPLSSGSAAAAGAKTGALGSVRVGAELAGQMLSDTAKYSSGMAAGVGVLLAGAFLAAGIVVAPVAAIVGAGVGAGVAPSEPEAVAAAASMTAALDAAQPADALRSRVVALAEQRAGRRVHDCGDLLSVEACRDRAAEPVAVVLLITVGTPYFEVEDSIVPDLRLLLSADAQVIRSSDTTPLYRRAWIYRGRQYGYLELAADDAALFHRELGVATDALAAKVVDDLMIGGREEVHASAEQPEGTVWTVLPPSRSNGEDDCP